MSDKTSKDDIGSRKQQILSAAQRCFSRYGFAKTTLDDIAASVGMKKASLYYYYDNKESIFRDVIEHETTEFIAVLKRQMITLSDPLEKLFAFARIRLNYFRQFVNLHDLSISVILEVKPLIDRLYQNFRQKQTEYLQSIIEEGILTGHLKECDSAKTAAAILIVLQAVEIKEFQSADVQFASDVDYAKLQEELDFILALMINGLKTPPTL